MQAGHEKQRLTMLLNGPDNPQKLPLPLVAYLCTKFDHSSFSRSRDMVVSHQNLNGSRDLTTPLSGMICRPRAGTCYDQPAYQI